MIELKCTYIQCTYLLMRICIMQVEVVFEHEVEELVEVPPEEESTFSS